MSEQEAGHMIIRDFARQIGTTTTELKKRYSILRNAANVAGETPPDYLFEGERNQSFITPEGQNVLGNKEEFQKALAGYRGKFSDWIGSATIVEKTDLSNDQLSHLSKSLVGILGEEQAENFVHAVHARKRIFHPDFVNTAKELIAIRQEKTNNRLLDGWDDVVRTWAQSKGIPMNGARGLFVAREEERSAARNAGDLKR